MAGTAHQGKKADKRLDEIEIEPGAWERFEKAVEGALHTTPKPHKPKADAQAAAKPRLGAGRRKGS